MKHWNKAVGYSLLAACVFLLVCAGWAQNPKVAFASDRSGRFQIWTADPANVNGTLFQVTTAGGGGQVSRSPSWSQEKGQIAYQFGAPGVRGIHVINPDGTNDQQVTPPFNPCGDDSDPAWSPDGNFIAYTCLNSGHSDIYVHDFSSGQENPLAVLTPTNQLRPAWSPDGSQVAFVSSKGAHAVVNVLNINSHTIHPLSFGTALDFDPAWSPDGSQIAFSSTRSGNRNIYTMTTACPEVLHGCPPATQLTTAAANDSKPAWSPDGRTLVFVSNRTGPNQLYSINPSQQESSNNPAVPLNTGSANYQDPAWLSQITALFDPVPNLLAGPSVTTDPNVLATRGRSVQGIAADGVSRVVLRIPANFQGQQFLVKVLNDISAPWDLNDDGGVADPTDTTSTTFQGSITVTSQDTPVGPEAFVVYLAPVDFVRPTVANDQSQFQRMITLAVVPVGMANFSVPVSVVRPPVILIHGTGSNPSYFDQFAPLQPSAITSNPLFVITTLDYSSIISPASISSWNPPYSLNALIPVRRNVLGLAYNAPILLSDLIKQINAFKSTSPSPTYIPVAAVQADIVAHSLGGLMARGMAHVGTTYPGSPFYGSMTYGAGYIHKLITLGTPHLGTNLALRTLDGTSPCVGQVTAAVGQYSFQDVTIMGTRYYGAVGDQIGDPTNKILSPTLVFLNTPRSLSIPAAFIAASFGPSNYSVDIGIQGAVLMALCHGDFLADSYSFAGWPGIFNGQPSDVIVPLASATIGQTIYVYLPETVHGAGTVGFGGVGFAGPHLLDPASEASSFAMQLLNTNVKDMTGTIHFVNIP